MKSIRELDWINLVAYVLIEQLFLASFLRLDPDVVGYVPVAVAAAKTWMRWTQDLPQAQGAGLLLPVCRCPNDDRNTRCSQNKS
jgi:hypothetical protein